MANLSGTWLGTYWQQTNPTRFEATFIQGGNTLSGNILDGNYLGEATLSGKVIGHKINFAKQYLIGSQYIINYVGTISEDENFIQGQWLINRFNSGIWEAHRSNENLMLDLKNIVSEDLPLSLS
ncbi:MAG: hypothetical protein O4861_02195 [Trichodesmium sp. St16_bin4-tuft]|jgi:hypothetical protein|uniref:Uncharacterized protein n=1 Tax=Trichodesmium erythraeum (strain IMS101) TaxID=203124 RepID=Q110Y7_TRIEI|nr:hypothetical protein [Trichodesmium erythraeum GBRTRLIN201]MCH2049084.1 hypothetical protein [Trichodesmium sp. ALOHA_ZT_67]MCL2926760.1 hypothetical protein [Trichodesmium sp. MAG_R01]MDE5070441.1 hypothetical protein [Trichodesmium sp. St5_bin8]MDE5078129.1 hypothetical protein [Trichodesmium sp. St2_bin6]MDE5095003.1 hypothetical protein [Trichodesmium sp. St11_bin5]MDE5097208.1 hypothetical protein [Trichodesmium sp. St16_bin4-tuft]MDE5102331.1 hypothetical protein [Trichodesmium sp. 